MLLYLFSLAQIVGINLVLSGDNALLIAMACKDLPTLQRRIGILFGALGAILARIVLVLGFAFLLHIPGVKLLGGLFLFYVAFSLVRASGDAEHAPADGLWSAVATIVVADVVMSLDNVVALVAAAAGHIDLLVLGPAISVALVVIGAELLSWALERFPWIAYVGALLLVFVAFETVADDPLVAWL